MGSHVWSLISLGVSLNLALGILVSALKLPLYLDSLGTVLVGLCAGPVAGSLTGLLGILLMGLSTPSALPFLPVACLVGLLAGWGPKLGILRSPWLLGAWGAVAGVLAAAAAAPIATLVFGGVTGGGTDILVALFRSGGRTALEAAFLQSLAVDPADKLVCFLLAGTILRALPRRSLAPFRVIEYLPIPTSSRRRPYKPQSFGNQPAFGLSVNPKIGLFQRGTGLLYRANPTLKLLSCVGATLLLFVIAEWRVAGIVLVLTLAILAVLGGKTLVRALTLSAPILAPLAVSLILIQGWFGEGPHLLALGTSWSVSGLTYAMLLLSRVAFLMIMISTYLITTPLERFAEVLLRLRLPYPFVFTIISGVNLFPQLQARIARAAVAAQSRGLALGEGGWIQKFSHLKSVVWPALGSLFDELPGRAACLESRGFSAEARATPSPRAWSEGPEPTLGGSLAFVALTLVPFGAIVWASV